MSKFVPSLESGDPRIPREIGSARLVLDSTWTMLGNMFSEARTVVLRRMERLISKFLHLPLSKAPMTPLLSEWIVMRALEKFEAAMIYIANSRAIPSSQPMSREGPFQLLASFHASHLPSNQMPIPQEVEAST